MEEGVIFHWNVFRSILSIFQWWAFNVTVIIVNKWIFQVLFPFFSLLLLFYLIPSQFSK
ncbi:hypothetical protein Lalb_Chr08g0241461 [Lupinus albus]|uniref:Uncharacterized protein n=1 Tax=Lupinus albus TaxID=3870 RepID=A0A6A4Q4B4_LUPAL|nr:hypothetical protein Lalb_Chr08g0241461 [Lupinus albus]